MTARLVPLGEVSELRSGVGFPKRFQGRADGDFPFAKVGDISAVARSGGRRLSGAANHVMSTDLHALRAKPFPPGTIVFAKIGEAIRQNFRAVAQVSILLDNNVMGAIPSDQVDPDYLFHFLASLDLYRFAQSTTVPSLRKSELARIVMPLPTIEEQRRIAAVLDAADALRAKRRQALAKLDSLTHAIFFEMFGDRRNPERDRVDAKLGDCVELFSGSTLPEGEEFGEQVGGYALVKVSDLARDGNEKFITSTREWSSEAGSAASTCPSDSIVFAKRGGAIAKNRKRITTIPSVLDPNLMGVTPKSELLTLAYLYAWFERLDLQSIQSGSSVPQLNKKDLAPLKLKLPRVEDQNKYARLVDNVDSIKSQMLQQSLQLDTLFASLQQKAFRGEL